MVDMASLVWVSTDDCLWWKAREIKKKKGQFEINNWKANSKLIMLPFA